MRSLWFLLGLVVSLCLSFAKGLEAQQGVANCSVEVNIFLDRSYSMYLDRDGGSIMDLAVDAILQLVDQSNGLRAAEIYHLNMYEFIDSVRKIDHFDLRASGSTTSNRGDFEKYLDRTRKNKSSSALNTDIVQVLQQAKDVLNQPFQPQGQVVIVISDFVHDQVQNDSAQDYWNARGTLLGEISEAIRNQSNSGGGVNRSKPRRLMFVNVSPNRACTVSTESRVCALKTIQKELGEDSILTDLGTESLKMSLRRVRVESSKVYQKDEISVNLVNPLCREEKVVGLRASEPDFFTKPMTDCNACYELDPPVLVPLGGQKMNLGTIKVKSPAFKQHISLEPIFVNEDPSLGLAAEPSQPSYSFPMYDHFKPSAFSTALLKDGKIRLNVYPETNFDWRVSGHDDLIQFGWTWIGDEDEDSKSNGHKHPSQISLAEARCQPSDESGKQNSTPGAAITSEDDEKICIEIPVEKRAGGNKRYCNQYGHLADLTISIDNQASNSPKDTYQSLFRLSEGDLRRGDNSLASEIWPIVKIAGVLVITFFCFLSTIPHRWTLEWIANSLAISLVIGGLLFGVLYYRTGFGDFFRDWVGDSSLTVLFVLLVFLCFLYKAIVPTLALQGRGPEVEEIVQLRQSPDSIFSPDFLKIKFPTLYPFVSLIPILILKVLKIIFPTKYRFAFWIPTLILALTAGALMQCPAEQPECTYKLDLDRTTMVQANR